MKKHDYDEDGCCYHCGFDGAERAWWKGSTYEGQASDAARPECVERESRTIPDDAKLSVWQNGAWLPLDREFK